MTFFFTRSSTRRPRFDPVRISRDPETGNAGSEPSAPIPGRIVNAGEQGVCVESDQALLPGTTVSIEMILPDGALQENVSRIQRGKVIWCRSIEPGRRRRFWAGIEILEKVMQARIPVLSLV